MSSGTVFIEPTQAVPWQHPRLLSPPLPASNQSESSTDLRNIPEALTLPSHCLDARLTTRRGHRTAPQGSSAFHCHSAPHALTPRASAREHLLPSHPPVLPSPLLLSSSCSSDKPQFWLESRSPLTPHPCRGCRTHGDPTIRCHL